METTKWMTGLILMLFTFSLVAQDRNAQQRPASGNQEVNESQTDEPANDDADRQQGTADTPGSAQAAADANSDETDSTAKTPSNAPAVPQMTSSSSGSPAVLAGEDGEERDGTNTMQRASMNMVGSPAGNLNLSEGQTVDPDTELADRQKHTQEKQVSAQSASQRGNTSSEANEINNNSRKENNALSDQNISSKNGQSAVKEDEKKDRRKRRKDRG